MLRFTEIRNGALVHAVAVANGVGAQIPAGVRVDRLDLGGQSPVRRRTALGFTRARGRPLPCVDDLQDELK